mgnify:CR=1 FL=1
MYHFFIREEMISEGKVVISGSDVNHIKNVLRMKSGEELSVSLSKHWIWISKFVYQSQQALLLS